MFYPAFLSLMSQLIQSHKARVIIDTREVTIEKLEGREEWVFSTTLNGLGDEVFSCFSSTGAFRFQPGNSSLHLDSLTASIYVVQKIQMPAKKYIPFKQRLTYFLEVVSQYEEMFTLQMTL